MIDLKLLQAQALTILYDAYAELETNEAVAKRFNVYEARISDWLWRKSACLPNRTSSEDIIQKEAERRLLKSYSCHSLKEIRRIFFKK